MVGDEPYLPDIVDLKMTFYHHGAPSSSPTLVAISHRDERPNLPLASDDEINVLLPTSMAEAGLSSRFFEIVVWPIRTQRVLPKCLSVLGFPYVFPRVERD